MTKAQTTRTLKDLAAKMERALLTSDVDAYTMLQDQMADIMTRNWKR